VFSALDHSGGVPDPLAAMESRPRGIALPTSEPVSESWDDEGYSVPTLQTTATTSSATSKGSSSQESWRKVVEKKGATQEPKAQQWTCTMCTYINPAMSDRCAMCETPNPLYS